MSAMNLGKYDFLPWSRRGIVSQIEETDTLGKSEGIAIERPELTVDTELNGAETVIHTFKLYSAADVTGIKSDMIIRSEPLDRISDYEPNLLPYVEFYDEDFPWRYTPAKPSTNSLKLRPWIALVILEESEFENTNRRTPSSSIIINNLDALPPNDELHLWAHSHSNLPHTTGSFSNFLEGLEEDAKTDPDGLYSRLISPRKLKPNTSYNAFIIPTYETGRLAGLGQDTSTTKAQKPSWPGASNEFPFYHRWSFRTGADFDFESLVKLLKPRIMDKRVGTREMDCSRPGFRDSTNTKELSPLNPNILFLEGALKAPDANSSVIGNVAQPFFEEVKDLLNLNISQIENKTEDPFVTLPYYGMQHAKRKRNNKIISPVFVPNTAEWQNELNRDPRHRVLAGFGVNVVQEHQEKFMDAAWEQLEKVVEANRLMRQAKLAEKIAERLKAKTVDKLSDEKLLSYSNQLMSKVLLDRKTVFQAIRESKLSKSYFDPTFTKMMRAKTSIRRELNKKRASFAPEKTVSKVNKSQKLAIAPKVQTATIMRTVPIEKLVAPTNFDELGVYSVQSNLEATYVTNLKDYTGGQPAISKMNRPITSIILEDAGVVPMDRTGIPILPTGNTDLPVLIGTSISLNPTSAGPIMDSIPNIRTTIPPISSTTGTVRLDSLNLPSSGVILNPDTTFVNPIIFSGLFTETEILGRVVGNETLIDREDIVMPSTSAITDANRTLAIASASIRYEFAENKAPKKALKMAEVVKTLSSSMSSKLSYRRLLDRRIKWTAGTQNQEEVLPAMAYPDLPQPTYKYLVEKDKELLLPNLKLIPDNTLSLLRTNQKFIESYLVGLNYEMGRELLWREYPTDQRGSYFRQFWDTDGLITPDAATPENSEELKDIKPIHTWDKKLGEHNARDADGDSSQLVFVIRGDLLKKFPNTVIYAQKAHKDGDNKKIRQDLTETQFAKEIKFPQYQAQLPPDIKLLGFDLTIEQAAGSVRTPGFNDKQGWFFMIAEVPGEPRFGMDIGYNPNVPDENTWNDLSWENMPNGGSDFVQENVSPGDTGLPNGEFNPPNSSEKGTWGRSSADMAAILFQRPVMVAVHATEMLDVVVEQDTLELDFVLNEISLLQFIKTL